MKATDLVPNQWYFCEENKKGCQYFMFISHHKSTHRPNVNWYLIQGIDGLMYNGSYKDDKTFREITPEEKLELL